MTGERMPVNDGENNIGANSIESGETTFQNLGDQVKFDPGRAERLRNGEEPAEVGENTPREQSEVRGGNIEYVTEEQAENPERSFDVREQEQDGEGEENQSNREKTRAEKQLEAVREKLEKIDQELLEENGNKEKIEEEIAACETAIENNTEQHNQLTDKINKLKLEIKKTKRNVISGFTSGLKIAKNLALGRHDETRRILGEINNNVDANEKAMNEHGDMESALEANEDERVALDNAYADARDERGACANKISRLEHQREQTVRQIEMLESEIANEAWTEAWKDAQEGIKAEMGTNNMAAFRRELSAKKEKLDENLEEDLNELDTYRNPSRIQRLMRTEEELQRDIERADEVEGMLRDEHDSAAAVLDSKREKVDRYFPTWQERVKNIRENSLISGALSTLKRKILMRIYGIA